ncbi:hypothetical protein A3H81_00500 [Candidatus Daviesbacteria bacterium RIFCSPLOWO2_02_FULL_38_18]|nr:MAG: hypothetical protein A3H81_00500 [Candidatus Daviesbacteria bacterium RIFCSPLOWO2_02_FULL_38_18]OGE73009.1 MAG: hypothetical protein A3H18_00385 [Candidatus Daviesbacteria bacterium RIFCSPLOWO2_12_FULL_38_10]HCB23222.1 hypothetical protein [Candidatus Daviesbacteria bacterium]
MKSKNKLRCPQCQTNTTLTLPTLNQKFHILYCNNCFLGFTYPVPKNIGKYYSDIYWKSPGVTGILKEMLYQLFQARRKKWIKKYLSTGKILDVGSGEGIFGRSLSNQFKVINLDIPGAEIKNPDVIKKDFIKWQIKQKFDAVVFWESLEHISNSAEYIKKASSLLNKNGLIMIEFPRYNSLESKIFSKYWFHLDPPRHLSHLTIKGLIKVLKNNNLKILSCQSVIAPEYSLGGFVASILAVLRINTSALFKKNVSLLYLVIASPILMIVLLWQIFLYLINQSPIGLIIAKNKKEKNY